MRPLGRHISKIVKGILWGLICLLTILPVWGHHAITPLAVAAEEPGMVQQGIDLYEKNELDQARNALESAELIYPDNYAVPYYLGLIDLKQERRGAAIAQWKRYVSMAPQDDTTMTIRKNITMLLRKEAQAYAKQAVADEARLLKGSVDENTVAVSAFENLGSDDLGPLGKGMAAMIIADLSHFKDLKVVEREKLQALLAEMELGTSGLVDQKSAPKVGKLLRAKYITSGSLTDLQKRDLQVASILQDADLNTTMASQDIQGKLNKFYNLQKQLSCRIVTDLGRSCKLAPKAFNKIHTKSMPAAVSYSYGLDYADEENYDEARAMFQKAVEEDPDFELAHAALLATPFAAMLLMSESQMISSASASAPAASATTTGATAATTVASAGGGGVGLGTTAAIAGGVALAGGAAAVALSSPDDGGDSSEPPGIEGQWAGTWATNDESGTFRINLTSSGNALGGDARLTGTECISEGTISGNFNGTRINITISSAAANATFTGNVNLQAGTLEGTLELTTGPCIGEILNINASRTGNADVEW